MREGTVGAIVGVMLFGHNGSYGSAGIIRIIAEGVSTSFDFTSWGYHRWCNSMIVWALNQLTLEREVQLLHEDKFPFLGNRSKSPLFVESWDEVVIVLAMLVQVE
jgi:hypothetical protein